MQSLAIESYDNPSLAPDYKLPENRRHAAFLKKAVIVHDGTEDGLPTIDLQFQDENGVKFIAMITARLLKTVIVAAEAKGSIGL